MTSTTTTTTSTMTTKICKVFKIDQRQVCLEFVGRAPIFAASHLCSSSHGKLPLPTNQKENDDYLWAFRIVLWEAGKLEGPLIVVLDVNDDNGEGNFTTSTGEPVEWFNWRKGQPDNHNNNEDYVHMDVHENVVEPGKWNDVQGSYLKDYDIFCEYEL